MYVGIVKRIRDKAEWEAILADADHYIGLIVTSPLCGAPCAILNDQVVQIVDSLNSLGVRIEFFIANIWETAILSEWLVEFVPTVIILRHGDVIVRYEDLLDWGKFYDLLFGSGIFSPAPSPSEVEFPLPPQSGL